jgi:hypothetical protein
MVIIQPPSPEPVHAVKTLYQRDSLATDNAARRRNKASKKR